MVCYPSVLSERSLDSKSEREREREKERLRRNGFFGGMSTAEAIACFPVVSVQALNSMQSAGAAQGWQRA